MPTAPMLAWLMWLRRWRIAGYWSAAIVFGQLAATIFKLSLQRPRPLANLYDGLSTYAFPSGHAVMSTVVYGFLAVLIARQLSRPNRWVAYAMAALLIGAIAEKPDSGGIDCTAAGRRMACVRSIRRRPAALRAATGIATHGFNELVAAGLGNATGLSARPRR